MLQPMQLTSTRCVIIGEVAQAHDGSLGTAHAFIDAIADAGADAVKFQTHIAAAESTPGEPWRVKFSPQDETRYQYWQRMEFTPPQWQGLRDHADQRGLLFLSTPFSPQAVDLLKQVGVSAWKVASGETSNLPMIDTLVSTGLPILLSTGMSPLTEIDAIVQRSIKHGNPTAVLQCTSAYPCPPEKVGLNLLDDYRRRFGCAVGLSDHSGTIYPGLAAVTLGIEVLEVHVTLSRRMFGPDVIASVTVEELKQLVDGVRFIERMKAHPVDKDQAADALTDMRRLFTKSIVAAADLPAGAVLTEAHVALKKPGSGLPPEKLPQVVGRRLRRALSANALIQEDDLD